MENLEKVKLQGRVKMLQKVAMQPFFVVLFVLLEEQKRETWKMFWHSKDEFVDLSNE